MSSKFFKVGNLILLIILGGGCISGPPSTTVSYEPCDNDRDGDCDSVDFGLVTSAIGSCMGEDNYNRLADADRNGCVTENDRKQLFPEKT